MGEVNVRKLFRRLSCALPALVLLSDAALLVLFASADYVGGAVALGLALLCIPFALLARRAL